MVDVIANLSPRLSLDVVPNLTSVNSKGRRHPPPRASIEEIDDVSNTKIRIQRLCQL